MKTLIVLTILSALAYSQPASAQLDPGTIGVRTMPAPTPVVVSPTAPMPAPVGR